MATEKRLISAEMAKEMIVNHANEFSDVLNRREKALLIGGGTSCIDKCPTIDAVEVVRYKDCMYWERRLVNAKGFAICAASGMDITADDFCSYGERRTDNA